MKRLIIISTCLITAQPAYPLQNAKQYIGKCRTTLLKKTKSVLSVPSILRIVSSAVTAYGEVEVINGILASDTSFTRHVLNIVECFSLYYGARFIEDLIKMLHTSILIINNDTGAINHLLDNRHLGLGDQNWTYVRPIVSSPDTLLETASTFSCQPDIVRLLLQRGAQVNEDCYPIITPIGLNHLPVFRGKKIAIHKLLNFYKAKQELKPQISQLLYKKQVALLVQEIIEGSQEDSTGAHDITNIIKGYL